MSYAHKHSVNTLEVKYIKKCKLVAFVTSIIAPLFGST